MLNDRFAHVTEWKKAFVEFKASDAYQHTKGLRKEVSTSGRSLGDAPPRRAAHRNVNKRTTSKYIVNFVHMVQKYTGDDENKAKSHGKTAVKGWDRPSKRYAREGSPAVKAVGKGSASPDLQTCLSTEPYLTFPSGNRRLHVEQTHKDIRRGRPSRALRKISAKGHSRAHKHAICCNVHFKPTIHTRCLSSSSGC